MFLVKRLKLIAFFGVVLISSCTKEEELSRPPTASLSDDKYARSYIMIINRVYLERVPSNPSKGGWWDRPSVSYDDTLPDPYFLLRSTQGFNYAGWRVRNRDYSQLEYQPFEDYSRLKPPYKSWDADITLSYPEYGKMEAMRFNIWDYDFYSTIDPDDEIGSVPFNIDDYFHMNPKPDSIILSNNENSIRLKLLVEWAKK